MRAFTIWQPHASLFVERIKPSETRSWMAPKKYWGTAIGIHAGKHRVRLDELSAEVRVAAAQWLDPDDEYAYDLPMGAVIATATLAACVQVEMRDEQGRAVVRTGTNSIAYIEDDGLGDYSVGRWIWLFSDIQKLPEPIPARGVPRVMDLEGGIVTDINVRVVTNETDMVDPDDYFVEVEFDEHANITWNDDATEGRWWLTDDEARALVLGIAKASGWAAVIEAMRGTGYQ